MFVQKKVKDDLIIIIQNPFDAQTAVMQKGSGFGLSSVKRRLYLLFARKDLVATEATGTIFTTTLKIPQLI
ncbi:MAG: ATP-binding protein [Ferruginibacter sp.]